MPQGLPGSRPTTAEAGPIRPRTAIAWVVILAAVAFVVVTNATAEPDAEDDGGFGVALARQQVMLQYGVRDIFEDLGAGSGLPEAEAMLDQLETAAGGGPVPRRQRFAVVAGDLRGPEAALRELDAIERLVKEAGKELTPPEREVQDALRALHSGEGGPARLDEGRRALLRRELDWFGDLALAPKGSPGRDAVLAPARRLAEFDLAAALALLLLAGAGLVGAAVHVYLARGGGVRFRLDPGRAPGGIYAETFAAWFVLYLALSVGFSLLAPFLPAGVSPIAPSVAGMTASLGALLWPVLRGVPWGTVRDDLGLRLSSTPVRDALAGALCWVMALPVMALALCATCGLVLVESSYRSVPGPLDPVGPPHPLGPELVRGNAWILALVAASVVAPVVEEAFFRGALYRHLRDAAGGAGRLEGALIAGALSSLLFAAIHPQGLASVPLLMAVALPLCWAREWRGSLVAPITAHALHNALVTLFGLYQFRACAG